VSALGLEDPVFDSQANFRAILQAMARPGTIVDGGADLAPPAPLAAAAAAALLTLADFETPIWVSPAFAGSEVAAYLKFHTGAPLAAAPDRAAFALIDLGADALDPALFARGTPEYPDRSTTVVVQVARLSASAGLTLTGPGVNGAARLDFAPRPADFSALWAANRAGFPLGIDLFLAGGARLAALPRSTEVA
jgi:alpha-D-ribose 1-methylphosphonate 5-triphosphate synthase subunit PhnH